VQLRSAALLVLPLLSWAQELTLRPSLRVGDSFELELVRVREDSRRPQANGKSRTVVRVRVLEAGPKGFVLEWQQGATAFDNPEIVKNPIAAAAANAVKDMSIEAILGSDGEYVGLRNQAEVAGKLQSMLDGMLSSIGKQLQDPSQRQTVETLARRLMSPEFLLSAAASDVQTYFGLHGAVLVKGKSVETPIQQPSPLGSGTVPATFRVTLESLDAHQAYLSSDTAYDPRALAALTKQLAAQAAPGATSTLPSTVEMTDSGRYIYNRAFGLMNELAITRRIVAGEGATRVDGREIRLLTRPNR